MSSALSPLQAAVYARLTGDSALMARVRGVFDEVPENQAFPYIAIGDFSSGPWRTHSGYGEDVLIVLHIWSRYKGNKESLDILSECNRLLADVTDIAVSGYTVAAVWFESSQALRAPDGETRQIVARYRARVLKER